MDPIQITKILLVGFQGNYLLYQVHIHYYNIHFHHNNTHQDILIWGEHDGLLLQLFHVFKSMRLWQNTYSHHLELFLTDGVNNFIANMCPGPTVIDNALRELMINLWCKSATQEGRHTWGFKEVRYDFQVAKELKRFFPQAKVIFLTRNIIDCYISLRHWENSPKDIWNKQNTQDFIQNWVKINSTFLCQEAIESPWVFPITYETLTKNPVSIATKMLRWLCYDDHDFDFSVFDRKIYTDGYNGPDVRQKLCIENLSKEEIKSLTTPDIIAISQKAGIPLHPHDQILL